MIYTNLKNKIVRFLLLLIIYPCVIIASELTESESFPVAPNDISILQYNCEENVKKITNIINKTEYNNVLNGNITQTVKLKEKLESVLLSILAINMEAPKSTVDLYSDNPEYFDLGNENSIDNSDCVTIKNFPLYINQHNLKEEEMNYARMYYLYKYVKNKLNLVSDDDVFFLDLIKFFKSDNSSENNFVRYFLSKSHKNYEEIRNIINDYFEKNDF